MSRRMPANRMQIVDKHEVMQTTNYNLFVLHPQNRSIKKSILRKRMADLKNQGGWDWCRPMEVRQKGIKLEILDGQHRFTVAKELGLPVWYAISKDKTIKPEDINAHQNPWSLVDYVNSYAQTGHGDYLVLQEFCDAYKVPVSIAATLLCGKCTRTGRNATVGVRDGTFKVTNKSFAESVGAIICGIRPAFKFIATERAVSAVGQCAGADKFDAQRFVRQCQKYATMLRPCGTTEQYLEMFEQVYNWRNRTERLPLKFLAIETIRKSNGKSRVEGRTPHFDKEVD